MRDPRHVLLRGHELRRAGRPLFATVGIQVWERIDGANPTWQLVWTKPTVAGEVSQSGLRGMTANGSNLLVFPEGTDWSVVQLNPASGFAATWQYNLQNLQDQLGTGFGVSYVIGPYNNMASVEIGSTWYGLIGLGIRCHVLSVRDASIFACWQRQLLSGPDPLSRYERNERYALRDDAAGESDCSGAVHGSVWIDLRHGRRVRLRDDYTEAAEYGWGAYDTQANAVSGA